MTDLITIKTLQNKKKIFFISDLHLPIRCSGSTTATYQEDKVVAWLDYIKPETEALFILGDLFDFWFEYKYLVPKGAVRLQTKLLAFHQAAIPIYLFLGNHDIWSIDYLTQECGVQLFRNPASVTMCNHSFLVGHGDTINPTISYSILRKLYDNALLQSIVRTIPPDWLYGSIKRYLIRQKHLSRNHSDLKKKDRIFSYCKEQIEPFTHHDFYIFGHTHVPVIKTVNDSSKYCNVGSWFSSAIYGCFDGLSFSLLNF